MAVDSRPVVVFCLHQRGHFSRLQPLVGRLVKRGVPTTVYTHPAFGEEVRQAGARFVDLFERYPVDAVDGGSMPRSMRAVAHAARCGAALAAEVATLRPRCLIHDAFAVVGELVGRVLGIPHICVQAGHRMDPDLCIAQLHRDGLVRVTADCEAGVEVLRREFGMVHAEPFMFLRSRSPFLNIYCEPPEFVDRDGQRALEPVAFFGSVREDEIGGVAPVAHNGSDAGRAGDLRVYVSFGTAIWTHYRARALEALETISRVLREQTGVAAVISLGGRVTDPAEQRPLSGPGVAVHEYVDQRRLLASSDVFITHHGLNSTHEAIVAGVPMLSYPFFFDQPFLARRCQALGLALPLGDGTAGALSARQVADALQALAGRRTGIQEQLAVAREWERQTIAGRDEVVSRLLGLAGGA